MLEPSQVLFGALGVGVLVLVARLASRSPGQIRWRSVLLALGLQWLVAVGLTRVGLGRELLSQLARAVELVLAQSFAGSRFVFGELGAPGGGLSGLGAVFAFQVLPTIVFVGALFSVLYHLGVMQRIVDLFAWLLVRSVGATGAEGLALGASAFMGQTEAPLAIRPLLRELTGSELFLVMVAGMASVSGAILGAYVLIGQVEVAHLLTAVAMTVPASFAFAKIVVPEVERPITVGGVTLGEGEREANLLAAATAGASEGLKLALNVGAMLIAFIALVGLVNAGLGNFAFGGVPLSLERLLGAAMRPVAWLLGVPWAEADAVGSLLGTRTILNELVAFGMLAELELSARSRAIATVAICGFANVSSIGIQIGGIGALVPERRADLARFGVLALVTATLANFSSACVMGAISP